MKSMTLCCALLAAALVAGCGKTPLKRTHYEVHVYNSTSETLSIESPGEILTEREMKNLSADDKRAMTETQRADLGPNQSTLVYITQVRPFEIKVTAPASRTGLSHTFKDLRPDTRRSMLLDLGARGEFHLAPVFYKSLPNANKPVAPSFIAQHPPQSLGGPQALYELDGSYGRINGEPKKQVSVPRGNDYAVAFILVDAAGLRRAMRTASAGQ